MRPGIGASAFPATTHLELWYAYLFERKSANEHTTGKGNPQSENPDFTRYKSIPIADQNPVTL